MLVFEIEFWKPRAKASFIHFKMDQLSQLQKIKASPPPDTAENVHLREDLLLEARKLLLSLERPDNAVERVCYQVSILCYPHQESEATASRSQIGAHLLPHRSSRL